MNFLIIDMDEKLINRRNERETRKLTVLLKGKGDKVSRAVKLLR